MFKVQGSTFRVRFRVQGSGFRVPRFELRASALGFSVRFTAAMNIARAFEPSPEPEPLNPEP
jgi:hypothetical protein